MWQILAEAASNPSGGGDVPQVPSELVGIILSGLFTGVTAVIVAIIQRRKPGAVTAGEDPARPFQLTAGDWNGLRDRVLEVATRLDGHCTVADEKLDHLTNDVNYLKGQLGI